MRLEPLQIEDIYSLSPAQEGMLFHTLQAPGTGVYFEQIDCSLEGNLHIPAFKQAWQKVLDRHSILRTAFSWEDFDQMMQIVFQHVELPWQQLDWRDVPRDRQQKQLEALLEEERRRGFDLTQPPPMRLVLVQVGQEQYQFIWNFHHLLADGWSGPILLHEVFAFYTAFSQGKELNLSRPRPYRDYIAWLQEQDLAAAESFWQEKLQDFTTLTNVPAGQPSSASELAEADIKLPPALTEKLRTILQQNQLTPNTLVTGAWAILLSRYNDTNDILFGTTLSGRPVTLSGAAEMVGPFINTLPLRVNVETQESLLAWLQKIQAQQLELRQYEYSPLVLVKQWGGIPGNQPLFTNILVFENYPVRSSSLQQNEVQGTQSGPKVNVENIRTTSRTNYPFTILAHASTQLSLCISYDTSQFGSDIIDQILENFQTLLTGFAQNPNQSVGTIPILSPEKRQQLLQSWNQTSRPYATIDRLHDGVARQAQQRPHQTALVFGDCAFTYAVLEAQANQLAHYLHSLGVEPEQFVGIALQRTPRLIIALLATLKAGGAYVPVDPAYPQERQRFMLQDTGAQVLLTESALVDDQLSAAVPHVICLDTLDLSSLPSIPLSSPVQADHLAYTIYTSGSTGRPKGVAISHRSAVALCHWAAHFFPPEAWQGVLAATSISFDLSVFEIFATLRVGGTVILAEDALALPTLPARHQVRLVNTVPSVMRALLDNGRLPASIHTINLAGEPLKRSLVENIYRQLETVTLFNLYGPSEDTTYSTYAPVTAGDSREPLIGRPIANTQAYILDKHQQPVPPGVAGELYLGGDGLARGYLNRPGLTAGHFIPNPFSRQPGQRMYRTGDLARYCPDGNIEFRDRRDNQVKVRGYRIELGEIEAILEQHPHITQAAVTVWDGGNTDTKQLIAYVTGPQRMPTNAIRYFLKGKLPEYMLPAHFILLDTFPFTPNGKIDRQSLPLPDRKRPNLTGYVAPRTSTEETIANIWSDVLNLDEVGIYDNFFKLGGHSLLATQVISRIQQSFSIELPIRTLFENTTVAEVTEVVVTELLNQVEDEDLEEAIDLVEQLSEAEIDQLTNEKVP